MSKNKPSPAELLAEILDENSFPSFCNMLYDLLQYSTAWDYTERTPKGEAVRNLMKAADWSSVRWKEEK